MTNEDKTVKEGYGEGVTRVYATDALKAPEGTISTIYRNLRGETTREDCVYATVSAS